MPRIFKKKEFWGTLIALGIFLYLLKDISLDDIERLFTRVNLYFFIPAVLLQFTMVFFKGIRWRTIIEKTKKLPILKVVPLFAAGQVLNIVMPALTGQVGRLLLFSKNAGLRKTFVFSTVVMEVLFDAISLLLMILLLSMAFVFPAEYRPVSYVIAIATASMFILLYLSLTFKERIGTFGRRHLRGRWPGAYITLKKFALSFTKGIALLRSTQYFFRTLFLSLAAWSSQILVVHFLFKAFGLQLPFITAVVIMVINILALLIPITPGNAGTFELAVMAPLLAFKIAKSDAVMYALALHLCDLIPIMVMGLFFFHSRRMTIKEFKEEGEKEEIMDQVEDEEESKEVMVEKDSL
jgi:uncharacterized protein (TIRG00374 family)